MTGRHAVLEQSIWLVVVLVLACGRGDGAPSWATRDDSTAIRRLVDRSAYCNGCVELTQVVVLGDTSGVGYVQHTEWVIQDSSGNYWAGQYDDMLKVFDADGDYVDQVGREGSGPGEYSVAMPLFADGDGLVHVLDPSQARETILDPTTFEVRDVRPFPAGMMRATPFIDGHGYVATGPHLRDADGIGQPIHVIADGETVRSFGMSGTGIVSPSRLFRVLATDVAGRIYSTSPFQYLIEVWDRGGSRITGFEGPVLSDREPSPGAFTDEHPPVTKIVGLRYVDDLLWILIWEVRDDWREQMMERRLPRGRVVLVPSNGFVSSMYTTRLDVLDLDSNAIVARWRGGPFLGAFVGDGLLLEDRVLESGVPQLAVWRFDLRGPT